ncbi:MAG: gliding motility-associated C-terminal domain-containing protein [Bacteroidota bacterium]
MEKIFTFILTLFILSISANAQLPGASGNGSDAGGSEPPVPQDGSGTLGSTYVFNKCGLNYVTASNKLGQRFVVSCCPSTPGVAQPAAFNITGIPSGAVIEKAFLWFDISGNGLAVTCTITNPLSNTFNIPATLIGSCQDKCWSFPGTYSYRADVTSTIAGNGNYMISGIPTSPNQSGNDVDGATLMVIYSDASVSYRGDIVIFDGCNVVNGGTTTSTASGFSACGNSTTARAFLCIADLQQLGTTMSLNGGPFITTTEDWWNFVEVNTTVASGQNTSSFSVNGPSDCYNLMMVGLYYQTTSCQNCGCLTPYPLTTSTTSTNATCGLANGTGTTSASGGVTPYNYNWSNGATTATVTGLAPGTYIVTITDSTGCGQGSDTIVISNVGGVQAICTNVNVQCFGTSTGSATANTLSGQSPFTYLWSNSQTTQTATGLAAGSYTVIVTDAQGCMDTAVVTITQPTAMGGTITGQNATCFGASNGQATVNVIGGTAPYSYSWVPSSQTGQTGTGLAAGTYTVVVTDANGCTITPTVVIGQPAAVQNSFPNVVNVLCNGGSNGSATAQGSGGTGPYTYVWNTSPPQSGATATGLSAGNYVVTVTDANNCITFDTVSITQPPPPQDTLQITSRFCEGDSAAVLHAPWAPGFTNYQWYFDTLAIAGANSDSLQIIPSQIGFYSVTWMYNGCIHFTSILVVSTPTPYFLPDKTANIFTPNADGKNDIFYPYTDAFYTSSDIEYYAKEFSIKVYDRWGKLVYESNDYKPQWDGKYDGGKDAAEGTYYWIASYVSRCEPNKAPVIQTGFVHLMR